MTGVEILAMEEVVVDCVFNWTAGLGALGIVFGFFILIGVIISVVFSDWSNVKIGVILGLILGMFSGTIFGIGKQIPTEYETQYKVVISDEVSMSEFTEKYKIIEQEGRIYTVVERD